MRLMDIRRTLMGNAGSGGNMVHLHTYTHTDSSWEGPAKGNSAEFVATYAQDCTEDGLYIFIITNNSITVNQPYAATGAIKTVNLFGERTEWEFQREDSRSLSEGTNIWMLMTAGAIIDVYYISKDTLVGT